MQYVNLYTAQFPPKEKIHISRKASGIIIVIMVILISAASIAYWKIETLKKEYTEYQKTASFTQQALSKVKDELNQSGYDDKLKIDLLNIKQKINHKQALKNQLTQESTDISASFYKRFVALSNQDIKGLWLREIEFSENGHKITLTGASRNAGLFTQYLQNLSNELIFSGITFTVLHLDTDEKNTSSNIVNFIISTDKLPDKTPLESALKKLQQ
ncbi:MAG: PilN domain-containing protein [Gammaproteobacteria bacterium]|nr:PilN domain-containing protein [Gammaproteobacteria bacterium]